MFLGDGFISDGLGVRRALTLPIVLVLAGRVLLVLAPGIGVTGLMLLGHLLVFTSRGERTQPVVSPLGLLLGRRWVQGGVPDQARA